MAVGFCSEHSVEYLLAPRLASLFAHREQQAVSLFFWMRREGSAAARYSTPERPVRVAAIFARRPKLFDGPNAVEIKFNEELFEYASVARSVGIPTLAGAPLATTIFDLGSECPIVWFALEDMTAQTRFAQVEVTPPYRPRTVDDGLRGPLSDTDVVELVLNNSRTVRWCDVVEGVREIRNKSSMRRYVWWGSGYKPFLLIVWNRDDRNDAWSPRC
jgi:hypothetical protein